MALGGATPKSMPGNNAFAAECLDLPSTLSLGMSDNGVYVPGYGGENWYSSHGSYVSSLQQFLGVSVTGHFGPLTKAAVINWQKAHGISPIGIVGPATRAAMACEGRSYWGTGLGLIVNPTTGPAPLEVDLVINAGTAANVDFGDGTSGPINQFADGGAKYQTSLVHVYQDEGTYTISFKDISGHGVGSATITVSGRSNFHANLSATPTSGRAPLAVTFSSWYDSSFLSNFLPIIDYGDGTQTDFSPMNIASCGDPTTHTNCAATAQMHTYAKPGVYTAKLTSAKCSYTTSTGGPGDIIPGTCHPSDATAASAIITVTQ